jgi:GNAT superfamily N-acetyltransferase
MTDEPAGSPPAPVIRRGRVAESDAIAELYFRIREQTLARGSIPAGVHPLEDHRVWVREHLFAEQEVWVAETEQGLVGFMALARPDWISNLYLDETVTGAGLGSRFVAIAKAELGGSIQLWTFQSNSGAQRFYARHGFVPVQWTEGENEEQAPDVRMRYTPD